MLNLAGIKRSTEFSPNHTGNDSTIFALTTNALIEKGCSVKMYSEDEFLALDHLQEELIFTMGRNKKTVKKLKQLEENGKFIINSGAGIENCYRINMTERLIEANVPYPKSIIVSTANTMESDFSKLTASSYWIKRGDFHAIHKEDVSFANSPAHGLEILQEYQNRNITDAVISEHLKGDLVKFYGVRGTSFFYWFYPIEFNHSKFNAEANNGSSAYHSFDETALKNLSILAAESLDIHIYGGDAIIGADGSITFIDLNDWPSFAPCRDEAAKHIANCIYNEMQKHLLAVKSVKKLP